MYDTGKATYYSAAAAAPATAPPTAGVYAVSEAPYQAGQLNRVSDIGNFVVFEKSGIQRER